jgi:hypothetical protein
MKIPVKYKCHGAGGRYRLRSFDTAAPPQMCCERMADEYGGIIDEGLCGFPQSGNVCAMLCTASYPLSSGEIVHAATPISHCPWCGEPVEIVGELDPEPEPQETRAKPGVIPDPNF